MHDLERVIGEAAQSAGSAVGRTKSLNRRCVGQGGVCLKARTLGSHARLGIAFFTAALVVRIIYLFHTRGVLVSNYVTDSAIYDRWAQQILSGTGTLSEAFYMGPLYPYFVAVIYRLSGVGHFPVLICQAVLSGISCILVFALAKRFLGPAVGALSATLFLLYPVLVFYDGCLLGESLLVFLHLSIAYSLLRALDTDQLRWWISAGLLTGLAALGRANILLFAVLFVTLYVAVNRKGLVEWLVDSGPGPKLRHRFARSIVFLICTFAVILPVTARNYIVSKDLVLITSNFGLNFYIGNNADAKGDYQTPGEMYLMSDLTGKSTAENETGKILRPSQVSRYWFSRGLDFIRSEPRTYLSLLARKFRLFWNDYEIPQAENFYFARRYSPLLRIPILSFGVVASLSIAGLLISFARWRRLSVLHIFILTSMISSLVFFVVSRYRIHVVPFLIIFAAYAVVYVFKSFFAREKSERRPIFRLLSLASIGLLLVALHLPVQGFTQERAMSEGYNLHGFYRAFFHGKFDEAIRSFRRALEYVPGDIETYNNIGTTYFKMGEYDRAIEVFKRLIEMEPQRYTLYLNLGLAYVRTERYEDSVRMLKEAVRLEPKSVDAVRALKQAESRLQEDMEREEGRQ